MLWHEEVPLASFPSVFWTQEQLTSTIKSTWISVYKFCCLHHGGCYRQNSKNDTMAERIPLWPPVHLISHCMYLAPSRQWAVLGRWENEEMTQKTQGSKSLWVSGKKRKKKNWEQERGHTVSPSVTHCSVSAACGNPAHSPGRCTWYFNYLLLELVRYFPMRCSLVLSISYCILANPLFQVFFFFFLLHESTGVGPEETPV